MKNTSTEDANLKGTESNQIEVSPNQDQSSLSDFMHAVTEGNIAEAARILRTTNPARSKQLWPVRIGHLVRYVDGWQQSRSEKPKIIKPWRKDRIAVVGAGTAGLVCAGTLAHLGYAVTVYEGVETPGGVLRFADTQSNMSRKMLDWELDVLKQLEVDIQCNAVVGEDIDLKNLIEKENFSAIFIATGPGLAHSLGEGHSLNPIVSEHLEGIKQLAGALIVEEGKCEGDEQPVDALEHARAGTAAIIQSASAGKNGATTIHQQLSQKDWSKEDLDQEWDDFLDWCHRWRTRHTNNKTLFSGPSSVSLELC